MTVPGDPDESLAERFQRDLAVPIAFLASSLGVVCVVSVPDVLPAVDDLALVDDRFVGWAGVGAGLGIVLAAAALLAVGWVGSGPALSLGAAGSVFGLALAHDVVDPVQLSMAQVILGACVGCLLGGAASMPFELPASYRRRVVVAWVIPVLTGWPLLAWFSLHASTAATTDGTRLAQHPAVWVLAPVSALIVVWSALTMLLEPDRVHVRAGADWGSAWSGLLAITLGGGLAIMVLGFDAGLDPTWLRPLILLGIAGVVVTLAVETLLVPDPGVQVGYVCLAFVTVCLPVTVQLLVVVADGGPTRVDGWMALLLAVATGAGAVVGARRPAAAPVGFLVVAAACAGSWVMPDTQWLMAAGGLPLCLGMGLVFGAGARRAAATAAGWQFASMTVVSIVLLGTVASVALSWALSGEIPTDTSSARAAGRVFLGLTFALAVLAAAAVSVLTPRPSRRHAPQPGPSLTQTQTPPPPPPQPPPPPPRIAGNNSPTRGV